MKVLGLMLLYVLLACVSLAMYIGLAYGVLYVVSGVVPIQVQAGVIGFVFWICTYINNILKARGE